jgi:hypothetical protein
VFSVSDSRAAGSRRTSIIRISIVVVVLIVALVIALLALLDRDGSEAEPRGTAALALSRLDASDGRAYVGMIGDATDAVRLRRTLRAEFRSHEPRPRDRGSPTPARACSADLQQASGRSGRVVLLADATFSGQPAVVIAITDRGRVVAFVADAQTCEVRLAQSL